MRSMEGFANVQRAALGLKHLALSNLRWLEEHRAGRMLQDYYDGWSQLTEGERPRAFRLESLCECGGRT